MKHLFLILLLCSAAGYTAFNLEDCDLLEIEFFDVNDDYPASAYCPDRAELITDNNIDNLDMVQTDTAGSDSDQLLKFATNTARLIFTRIL